MGYSTIFALIWFRDQIPSLQLIPDFVRALSSAMDWNGSFTPSTSTKKDGSSCDWLMFWMVWISRCDHVFVLVRKTQFPRNLARNQKTQKTEKRKIRSWTCFPVQPESGQKSGHDNLLLEGLVAKSVIWHTYPTLTAHRWLLKDRLHNACQKSHHVKFRRKDGKNPT